jgi:hypothetical protein
MANHENVIRALVRAALAANPANPKAELLTIITGKYTQEVTSGGILISTSEAGGSVSFSVPSNFGPFEIMSLAEEAIQFIDGLPDPTAITDDDLKTRRIKRLKVRFDRNLAS